MREVLLAPEHSQWWLLSPGITLFFDRLVILRDDYENVMGSAGQSSYHAQIAQHLEALIRQGELPVIEIREKLATLKDNYKEKAEIVRANLYRIAENPDNPALSPLDIVKLTERVFSNWIAHNKRKVPYLHDDEPYRKLLERDLLKSWKERQNNIAKLFSYREEEMLERFRSDERTESTFTRLIASALQCMDLVDAGYRIYDPMFVEYLPAIAVLEALRTAKEITPQESDIRVLFNAYEVRMARYGEIIPLEVKISELPMIVKRYTKIRKLLERIDDTLKVIDEKDPARAFEAAKKEISPLVAEARIAAKTIDYGFWAAGLITSLIGDAVGLPALVDGISATTAALALVRRNVGRFAGAYALITDSMIMSQRIFHAAEGFAIDYEYFKRHYWDYSSRNST